MGRVTFATTTASLQMAGTALVKATLKGVRYRSARLLRVSQRDTHNPPAALLSLQRALTQDSGHSFLTLCHALVRASGGRRGRA